MKKIIFVVKNFFTKRDFNRCDIQNFLDDNITVEIWDLTEFLSKDFQKLIKPINELNADYVKKFKNINEIKNNIKTLKSDDLMSVHLKYNLETVKIFRLLSKYKINYIMYNVSSPDLGKLGRYLNNNIIKKFKKRLMNINFSNLFNYFKNFIIQNINPKIIGVYPVPFLLVGGAIYYKNKNKLIGKNTKIVRIHQRDYDLFLKNKKNNFNILNKKYAVFLDQAAPFNSENIIENEFIEPIKYYSSLENFFNFLKNKHNVDTIICAHPRSNNKLTNYIKNYKIVNNQTLVYVKNSSFVICHDSLSINFAVMYNKPLLFIYNEVLKNSRYYNHLGWINSVAGMFKKKPINVDEINNLNLDYELGIDKENYKKYFRNYIKFRGENKIISETIKGLI